MAAAMAKILCVPLPPFQLLYLLLFGLGVFQ